MVGAASTQGHALSVARERKMALHSAACHSVGVSFFPLVVEYLGGWSDEAIDIIKSIGRLQWQRIGISPNESRHTASIPAFSSFPLEGQCRPLDSPVPDPLPPGRWTGVIVELCDVFCAVFLCCLFYYYCIVLFLFYVFIFIFCFAARRNSFGSVAMP